MWRPCRLSRKRPPSPIRQKLPNNSFPNSQKCLRIRADPGGSMHKGRERHGIGEVIDRKSTRLNSSRLGISYAVFCLKKKNKKEPKERPHLEHVTPTWTDTLTELA